jgi:anhydro-N-acetylmuramic acid kinase
VVVHDDGPLAPQHHEPAAMALIAARTLHRLPSSLPRVTGARAAAVLGHVAWPTPEPT